MVGNKENRIADTLKIVESYGPDRRFLMDIVRDVQKQFGCVDHDTHKAIADAMGIHRVEVEGVVSFYHFLTESPKGGTTIYLTKGASPSLSGTIDIASAFERETGTEFGNCSEDDLIGLEWTSCIGMNDQEPAALINGKVFTKLTEAKVKEIVGHLRKSGDLQDLVTEYGDGNNASGLVKSMVRNNIRKPGDVIFGDRGKGVSIRKTVTMQPESVIEEIKKSNLRGRGGAGFPCGLKWEIAGSFDAGQHYVVCNADEGEPGTFKDRVILTQRPDLVFEGMAVCGYAIGAEEGIMYLRGEYEYLRVFLEDVLNRMRVDNLLGNNIAGKKGFNFDIRIQMGGGAYVCGEETALIESLEGKRGEPRDRPPFPVSRGYMDYPTSVNNVETLASAARIIEKGADWFRAFGTEKSSGTKVLSISGDVTSPGIYEFPFGVTVNELLAAAGAVNPFAVQIGGPSGRCIGREMFNNRIAFEDLATGGSIIVIGQHRNLLGIVHDFMEFAIEECCGHCTPCRAGNPLMLSMLEKVMNGRGTKSDIEKMKQLGKTLKAMSRCGMGLNSTNPVTSTIENFPQLYEKLLNEDEFISPHDFEAAVRYGREIANFN